MRSRGESLFEVVVALAVITLIIVGVVLLASTSIRNSTFARNNTQANRFAQEAAEWLRGERDAGWTVFQTNVAANPTYCLPSLSWNDSGACGTDEVVTDTIFTREVTFSCYQNFGSELVLCGELAVDTIQADLTVEWRDGQGAHTIASLLQLTNWRTE